MFLSGAIGAVLAASIGLPVAFASGSAASNSDEFPPSAVEDYAYPGAENILATKGIKLKKGDGHIVLADCDPNANQIQVMAVADEATGRADQYCFRSTAKTGYLTLELPRVFFLELMTSEQPISADVMAGDAKTTVDVEAGGFANVGEGVVGGARSTLVELRITG
ncbi:hypothetical protein AMK23_09255 [Streptomyces sp. CB02130]|nr:hypothetical protein AMK23_09255 [Streptomyces sp. CB02130]